MWSRDDAGVIIISAKRPRQVVTLRTLRKQGYTGPVKILVEQSDPTLNEYVARYGAMVETFRFEDVPGDTMDNLEPRWAVMFPRMASFDLARRLGWKYFISLDDDYTSFEWLVCEYGQWVQRRTYRLDDVFAAYLDALAELTAARPDVLVLAMAQSGDFVYPSTFLTPSRGWIRRKAMNVFFFDAYRPVEFMGRLNEDVNAYVRHGTLGKLFLTYVRCFVHQHRTQQQSGGATDTYRRLGAYTQSFYSLMAHPTGVRVALLKHRVHHRVEWRYTVPMIVRPVNVGNT